MGSPAISTFSVLNNQNLSAMNTNEMHSALEQAIKWGYITSNADDGATFPKYKNKVRKIWSREEAISAIETCADNSIIIKQVVMFF